MKSNFIFLTLFFLISKPNLLFSQEFGYFGNDDRLDITNLDSNSELTTNMNTESSISKSLISKLSKSVITVVKRTNLNHLEGGGFKFNTPSRLTKDLPVCPDQKFSNQVRYSEVVCGASLVANDLVLTAKDCISDTLDCSSTYSFIFDYTEGRREFSPRDVYHCLDVVFKKNINGTNLALIKLDRPVNQRTPLELNLTEPSQEGAQIAVVGPHAKLSLKTSSGIVRYINEDLNQNRGVATDLDCSKNDIGSPVFNFKGQIEGVVLSVNPIEMPLLPSKTLASEQTNQCFMWKSQPEITDRKAYVKEQKVISNKKAKISFIPKGCVYTSVGHFKDDLIKYIPATSLTEVTLPTSTSTETETETTDQPVTTSTVTKPLTPPTETIPTEVTSLPASNLLKSLPRSNEVTSTTSTESVTTDADRSTATDTAPIGAMPMTSRPRPPEVQPLEHDGIRFHPAEDGIPVDATDTSGWLRATDMVSGETRWLSQVFTAPPIENGAPEIAGGPHTVYIRRISFSDGFVNVEDELGRRFRVDPKNGSSTQIHE